MLQLRFYSISTDKSGPNPCAVSTKLSTDKFRRPGKADPFRFRQDLVVASTRGNAVTDVMVDGKPVTIGLNAYIKP